LKASLFLRVLGECSESAPLDEGGDEGGDEGCDSGDDEGGTREAMRNGQLSHG
jgi:hypothetical protein